MTWQSGGGGGIPGVTPDGEPNPGILVAGEVSAGGPIISQTSDSSAPFQAAVSSGDPSADIFQGWDAAFSTRLMEVLFDGTMKTLGDVIVHGKLKTGTSVTHTLGAYSGKSVPVYDEAGTLLGYMPLYA